MILGDRSTERLVFTHIPKTAGTSVRHALTLAVPGGANHPLLDRSTFGGFDDYGSLAESARRLIVHHPSELPDEPLIAGHLALSTTRSRYPADDHVTILRAPAFRLVSAWAFNRSHTDRQLRHWGSYAARFALARAPLADYLREPPAASHTDNVVARQILWPHPLIAGDRFIEPVHDQAIADAAMAALRTFSFVGLVEDHRLGERLGQWLGTPVELPHRNRTTTGATGKAAAAHVDDCFEQIAARTRIDNQLWRWVAGSDITDVSVGENTTTSYLAALAGHDPSIAAHPTARQQPRGWRRARTRWPR